MCLRFELPAVLCRPRAVHQTKRDLAAELLQAVREMKAGRTRVVSAPVIDARQKTGLSLVQFATLPGVTVRTLQGWEKGRKQPSGARTLLAIAEVNPKAVPGVASKSFVLTREARPVVAPHAPARAGRRGQRRL